MTSAAEHALEELVHQFADPLSFFRELVQNALDAGSEDVEIDVEFEAGEGPDGDGAMVVHVRDWGQGMTREIIDRRLTRLFSSAKDGDETKIGKFGIGFVSVFAIVPDAVVVDTGREGEAWRVVFGRERRFSLRRLLEPIEGTSVRLFKTMTAEACEDFRRRARRVVGYWCKHTTSDIRFDGEPVTEDFDLDATAKVEFNDGFSHIVVGHMPDGRTLGGYYNQGLTLAELRDTAHPGLSYKVSSPHLEHTLARDNLIRDEGYERIAARLHALVHDDLLRSVFDALHRAVEGVASEPTPELYRAAAWHAEHGPSLEPALPRSVARDIRGTPVAFRRVRSAAARGEVATGEDESAVASALHAHGWLVLRPHAGVEALLDACGGAPAADEHWVLAQTLEEEAEAPLAAALDRVLEAAGARVAGVHFGRLCGAVDESMVAISVAKLTAPTPVDEVGRLATSLLSRRRPLVINAEHPTVLRLRKLAKWEPEVAAVQLAKLFVLGERLDAKFEGALVGAAFGERCRRLTS